MEKYKEIENSIITKYRKNIWRKFCQGVEEYELVKDNDKIAVCISGGKDSMLMAKWEDINLEEIDMVREYLQKYTLNARPLCENSMEAISNMGTLFQEYVLGECEDEDFFEQAQKCIDTYYK